MAIRDEGFAKEALDQDHSTEEHSFDELAKDLAGGTLSRGRVLKLMGAAILGNVLSGALPGVAEAKKKKKKKKCPPGTVRKKKGKKVKCVPSLPPPPRTCTAGDALACTSCGTSPQTGNSCSCVPNLSGNPTCIDTKKGAFLSCNSDNECPTGSLCIEFFPCPGQLPGTFACAFPCGT